MSRNNKSKTATLLGAAFVAATLTAFAGLSQAQETKPAANAGQAPAKSWQTGISRTDLVRRDLDVEGREVIQVRVDFEPGVVSPKHSHPGVEVAYVIEGTFEYELEGQPNVILKAGESLYIPAGTAHVAKNIGKEKASELATYIVKKDTPLLILK
ncbi:cupin domain-containing protein [Pseudomonas fluorescens]|jgi:quercetin dioxygenase-like cupin family protein|uniref:cupin domain-containing protein n=1 Tax=Pseudomonas TaxID=286 RepID=UPI000BA4D075|nr:MULTISPECIES: cupin domain-containing protein [Pseudomonas]MDZ5431706.1 cupin domain-containing protein [Pseudomonas fluorescens]